MGVRFPPTQQMKKELIKKAVLDYNADAKLWNSLPGKKLLWPQDKFKIVYCDCRKPGVTIENLVGEARLVVKCCKKCGLPFTGEWD